ncbi:MAG: DUF4097 family beta strand repeat-containing protein [Terriglobales bacterium]
MANTVMTPIPPQPPIPPRQPRSIAGAIVLILLGIMFLAGTMGLANWHGLGLLFSKFWPLLLILWGIIKLIEHEQCKRAGVPGRGIGVGGVFLVLFVIMAGLIATGVSRVDWGFLRDNLHIDDNNFNDIFGGSTFDYNGALTNPVPAGANRLEINDDRGTVTVNVSDDKNVRVNWRKKVRAENQQQADDYSKKTDVTLVTAGKGMTLNANTQAIGDKGVSTDMDVYVPREMEVSLTSRHGDVTVNGMGGGVQINHQSGEVNINDLVGNAALTLQSSSLRLQHIKGDVNSSFLGWSNEVDVEDVDGAVHLNGDLVNSVRLVRVSKTVDFHSSRTDMEFARLDGRLDLDSSDLRADSLTGPMRLTTRSKDISLEGFSGDLRLQDENGSVDVSLHKPGNIQIDNHKGDVQLSVPPKTPLQIEARTHQGDIQSDYDEIKVESHGREANASGLIGTNGPRIAINCDKGDIEIRKGVVAAVTPAPPEPPAVPGKPTKALPAPKAKPVESEN